MKRRAELLGMNQLVNYASNKRTNHLFEDSISLCSVACIVRMRPSVDSSIRSLFNSVFDGRAETSSNLVKENINRLYRLEGMDRLDSLFDILYARRCVSEKDKHSGEICFPGGKLDRGENEEDSCRREVFEEVGYNTYDNGMFRYIGKINDKSFAYHRKGKQVTISCLLFLMNSNRHIDMNINTQELDSAFWIPVSSFFDYQDSRFDFTTSQLKSEILLNGVSAKESNLAVTEDNIDGKIVSTNKYTYRLPIVDHRLWGLTFLMTSSLVQLFRNRLMTDEQLMKSKRLIDRSQYFDIFTDNDDLTKRLNEGIKVRNSQFLISDDILHVEKHIEEVNSVKRVQYN